MGVNLWTKNKEKLREKAGAKVVLKANIIEKRQSMDLYILKVPS
jgi:hypothetical protein